MENGVYKRLQDARVMVKNTSLKKSGSNTYSGYDYFELADFLPAITEICKEVGICCIPNFTNERATLMVINTDNEENFIVFESPMKEISMKGCNEVQNLGSVQTYLRRYLYMNAFEIVENDLSEANTGNPEATEKPKKKSSATEPAEKTETTNAIKDEATPTLKDTTILAVGKFIEGSDKKDVESRKVRANSLKAKLTGLGFKEVKGWTDTASDEQLKTIYEFVTEKQ